MRTSKCLAACAIGLLLLGSSASAQNPIIRNQFSADPSAHVFEGRLYVYPSHDIPAPDDYPRKEWFCMADYHVFSSDNMLDWVDHGVIVSQETTPWVKPRSYTMWAPDAAERNGKYYFYFPANARDSIQRGNGIGVAVSDKPYGPFVPEERPMKGVGGIDPCVFIDDDGQAYMTWAGMGLQIAKLSDDMLQLASEPQAVQGLPTGMKEGPFMFKHDGNYYYTFPWVEEGTENLAYAMSKNPMGPYEFKGLIMNEWANKCWTNHHSIVNFKDQWYIFYHHNDYSPDFDKNRSVCVDSLSFNRDGTIRKVTPTFRGVGVDKATRILQLDRYSKLSREGASIEFINPLSTFEGWKTILDKDAWVQYNTVDFGAKSVKKIRVRAQSRTGATLRFLSDGLNGEVIGEVVIPQSLEWTVFEGEVKAAPEGVHNLTVVSLAQTRVEGAGKVQVDWVSFEEIHPYAKGAFETQKYRNFFAEMGYTQKQIDDKLAAIYHEVFEDPDSKCYFEVGPDMAYVSDIKNNDVRTEGMSYGLMIAVQLDKKDVFDRLWRWSKKYMQHQDGPMKGYFAWSLKTDGTRNSEGPASDGELYFVTALIFASNRWGNDTGIDYLKEAQNILNCSFAKNGENGVTPLISPLHHLITFVPTRGGDQYTDPSYHLPAFYEVWARWANDGRSEYWMECARKSREYLHKSIDPVTGLNPDTNNYDGSFLVRRGRGNAPAMPNNTFRFDSWRVPMNIALDFSWSCADREWQMEYGNKFQSFLYAQGVDKFLDQFNTDGTTPQWILQAGGKTRLRHGVGLVATAAAASLTATHKEGLEFVKHFWDSKNVPDTDGYYDAYYDGLLRLFSAMHLSGKYQIIFPGQKTNN